MDMKISSLFRVANDVVLVTGGATGLGEMAAQAFVQNGARVIIASRKEEALKQTTDRLNALGPGTCEYQVANLKDKAGCEALVRKINATTDRLSVLVNNTGVSWGAPYEDFPEHGWDKVMALNVKAVFYMSAMIHSLLQRTATMESPSRIINIASVAGLQTLDVTAGDEGGVAAPGHGSFSYGASKAACIHLSKILASKLAPSHITVNCICPGLFPSRMTQFGISNYHNTLLSRQPTGRIGKPSDLAGLVLFLSSSASAHLTGNVLVLDGGSTVSGWGIEKPVLQKI
ncbi:hypothetical protein ASPCAL02369 [Aspergillus calidoustus]|uniref:Uncharacterized protein n=1 Tax=Aspergillus calidoustus TaxID=454130 RepID=A0A0U5GMI2_ASPCI|nr:hypothetical protein ASPCAL02369 [Aspergillus calidoustus]